MGLALFFLYLLTTPARQPYGDEEEYLAVAENILTRGTTTIIRAQPSAHGQPRDVVAYSRFSLGQSLLMLPFAALELAARELLPPTLSFVPQMIIHALPALESAATCALLYLLIRIIGNFQPELALLRPTAAMLALLAGGATQLWPASRTLFADNSVAFLLTLSIYALVRFARGDGHDRWLIVAAWSMALMVLCKNLLVLACPAAVAYGLWALGYRDKTGRGIPKNKLLYLCIMATIPFLLAAALQLWYNELRYGSIWSSGYHEGRDGEFGFSTPVLVGLYGIFFSAGRSIFLYSPSCLLAFAGARHFFKRAPAEAALIAGVALPVALAYAKWWSWHGGWEWGARFYLFLIPLLMLASVPAWRWLDRPLSTAARRLRLTGFAVLIVASLGVQTLGLLIHPAAYWFLSVKELNIFHHPVYEKGVWEIRDDTLLPHFVPEFSPIAAHAWLAWATWNRQSMDDTALAASAPWVSLNPQWAPKSVRPYLGFDLWFFGDWPTGPKVMTALVLLAFAAFCGLKLRRTLQEPPFSRS